MGWRAGRITHIGCLLLALQLPAFAAIERLDDSASPRARVPAISSARDEAGRSAAADRTPGIIRMRFGAVEYRLATARYLGRRARIFYAIPAQIRGLTSPAGLSVEWRGLGALASGTARPGDRTPVWTGVIRDAWLNEAIDLTLQLDPRYLRAAGLSEFGLESYFEIEVLP